MTIRQILDKIDDNQIFVPAFQREYVWKRDNCKALFYSLLKEYPTGTMLTWETKNPPELKGKVRYNNKMGSIKLILDGQQRITTLYIILKGLIPPYYKPEEIKNDVSNLYINIENLELEYFKKTTMTDNPLWVNLTNIFTEKTKAKDIRKIMRNKGLLTEDLTDKIDDNFDLVKSIRNRDFLEQEIPVTASIKEAIDIFYIVNASGINLTDAELALAQITGYWAEAREVFKEKIKYLENKGFILKLDFLVYTLLGVLYTKGSELKKLHSSDNKDAIKEAWERLDNHVLDYVIDILKRNGFVNHSKEISSIYALVPFIYYVYHKEGTTLNESEINKIIKWSYYAQIRQRYTSQLPQKLDKDLRIIKDIEAGVNPFDKLLNNIDIERPLKITSSEFKGLTGSNPLFNLMKFYFRKINAVCLNKGTSLNISMTKGYKIESDDIFPYAVLKKHGYSKNDKAKYSLAKELTNKVVLSDKITRTKDMKTAEGYLKSIKNKYPNALRLQCIPEDENLWRVINYENFLEKRRELLADALNLFLEKITETDQTKTEVSIEELIQEGESSELEFKQYYHYSNSQPPSQSNKSIHKVRRTIAAFWNSEGGTLLIGVHDDKTITGLQFDYSLMDAKDANYDGFERMISELISAGISNSVAQKIGVKFHEINNESICEVNVPKGEKPAFIKYKNKGTEYEDFCIRQGNRTVKIDTKSEIMEYIEDNFNA
jgi:uncharacterized protein with ParB-like and HNH nuclease domain